MFREDTAGYEGNYVFDMIAGADNPRPSLTWSFVGAPRGTIVPRTRLVCP